MANVLPYFLSILIAMPTFCGGDEGRARVTSTLSPADISWCKGRCDEEYFPGYPCYCNSNCDQYENCCEDYYPECRPDYIWNGNWESFEGHSYKYFADNTITGEDAAKTCIDDYGGMLASISNEEEFVFVVNRVVKRRTLNAYIGGTDNEKEGMWMWFDGTRMPLPTDVWHKWFSGQPANVGNCAVLTNYVMYEEKRQTLPAYYWIDYSCIINPQEVQGYICERTLACESSPCQNNGSCFYVGGGEEYICGCTEGYVGVFCEIQLIEGETWTRCGDTKLTGSGGIVTSPLFPRDYPPNVKCKWEIDVGVGKTIAFQITLLNLEKSKNCSFDSLTITDGSLSSGGAKLVGPSCGNLEEDLTLGRVISTSRHQAMVTFLTDGTAQGAGFKVTYKADTCGRGIGNSGCQTPGTYTTDCGQVVVNNGPSHHMCSWFISVSPGSLVNITFTDFNIPEHGEGCKEKSLVIYDGANPASSRIIERACGRRLAWSKISTSSQLYLVMEGVEWKSGSSRIVFQYNVIDSTSWRMVKPLKVVEGDEGEISTSNASSLHVQTTTSNVNMWLVRVKVGRLLSLEWTLYSTLSATIQVFDGHSEYSALLVDMTTSETSVSGRVNATTFQLLVKVTSRRNDSALAFIASYKSRAMMGELSGCYRPLYSNEFNSLETENSVISPDQPVILMVSSTAKGGQLYQYDNGLYCHWNLAGQDDRKLLFDFLDLNIPSNEPGCPSDGLVVVDKATGVTYGPYCGAWSGLQELLLTLFSQIAVYFYSDTRPEFRAGGLVRARVYALGSEDCDLNLMETATTPIIATSCGVLLSPWFPSLVPPGVWTWLLDSPGDTYIIVNVHYVRGPNTVGANCEQFFQLSEVSQDAGKLRQSESVLFKLCEDIDVYIPDRNIKNPPKNRLYVELNTVRNTVYQRWEFKISYSTSTLRRPDGMDGPAGACPQRYIYYRGSCYMYEQWVLRHYQVEKYVHQTSWQASEQRCQEENATLVTIKDEEEAEFLKYALTTVWYWNPTASWQLNHQFIYVGLTNRLRGEYLWEDGTQLAYSDWFQPGDDTYQTSIAPEEGNGKDFLGLKTPEPKADTGSLCTGMLMKSPFSSLNWVKLPCDYPVFRAGLICKKEALETKSLPSVQSVIQGETTKPYVGCAAGWILVRQSCYQLFTNYSMVMGDNETESQGVIPRGMTYAEAEGHYCEGENVDTVTGRLEISSMEKIQLLLGVWRHGMQDGDIWISGSRDGETCSLIEVYKTHRLNEEVDYQLVTGSCDMLHQQYHTYNIVCRSKALEKREGCKEEEFTCKNGVCASIDFICDGTNDCFDNSDEDNCPVPMNGECSINRFQCSNGRCISMALFCDFVDNCGDNSDENICVTEECGADGFICGNGQCIPGEKACDLENDCLDSTDEAPDICYGHCRGFQCFSGLCIPAFLQHDIISDCPGLALEDETYKDRNLKTIFDSFFGVEIEKANAKYKVCTEPNHARCNPGYESCFDRSSTCEYETKSVVTGDLSLKRVQDHCRDGSHVRMHCGELECDGMFHCPMSYCLPYNALCDGRKDCPGGEDEVGCESYSCPGLFHCKGETYCLPHNKVCDGVIDCPKFREDEKYCANEDILCKGSCQCEGNIAHCSNRSITNLPTRIGIARHLRSIDLSFNKHLKLTNSSFSNLHWLGKLDLGKCALTELPTDIFKDVSNLYHLFLDDNMLSLLQPGVFNGLSSLRILNLNKNMISSINRETFIKLTNIRQLIITNNSADFMTMSQDAFDEVKTLKTLYSDAFKFCCIAKHVEECTPEPDEFSSCEDLMANQVLQISIWILGAFAFAGNIFVVVWRLKTDRKRVPSFFIINLGCSDFLMGIYMLIIASVDTYYRGNYIVHAESWRASALCSVAGILATVSSEVSVYMLSVITADRLFAILFPFKAVKFRMFHARIVVLVGWVVCVILSVIPVLGIPYFGDSFYGRTGVCLPFEMNNDRLPGWEYSVAIFLFMNLISFLFIAIAYTLIFISVKASASKMGDKATSTTDEYALAKKLMVIVISDFSCWVPIILIGLAALGGARIPAQVSAVIAVFVLPLNSAINPILYTMSAIDCSRGGKKKNGRAGGAGKKYQVKSESNTTISSVGTSNGVDRANGRNPNNGSTSANNKA